VPRDAKDASRVRISCETVALRRTLSMIRVSVAPTTVFLPCIGASPSHAWLQPRGSGHGTCRSEGRPISNTIIISTHFIVNILYCLIKVEPEGRIRQVLSSCHVINQAWFPTHFVCNPGRLIVRPVGYPAPERPRTPLTGVKLVGTSFSAGWSDLGQGNSRPQVFYIRSVDSSHPLVGP
jgi:hypothetical protein